jgi:predicted transcriptional regulator YheO
VLHDLTDGYDHTIVDIVNGHITNREIGDCGSNLGLEILRGTVHDGDRFNYITHTPAGRILRSSSIYIKDDGGKVIGSICINLDITETVQFEGFLKNFNRYEIDEHGIENDQEEVFVKDVNDLLDHLIRQGQAVIGKPIKQMDKEEKIAFVGFLDKKGAFLITKSGDKICELLNISKFTLYNYLEIYHKGG